MREPVCENPLIKKVNPRRTATFLSRLLPTKIEFVAANSVVVASILLDAAVGG